MLTQFNVRLSPEVVQDIDKMAEILGLTRGAYFSLLHERYKRQLLDTLCQPIQVKDALALLEQRAIPLKRKWGS